MTGHKDCFGFLNDGAHRENDEQWSPNAEYELWRTQDAKKFPARESFHLLLSMSNAKKKVHLVMSKLNLQRETNELLFHSALDIYKLISIQLMNTLKYDISIYSCAKALESFVATKEVSAISPSDLSLM